MHIAFVHSHYESLGIEYLSAVLKKQGHKTSLIFEPALFHNFFFNKGYLHKVFNFKNQILYKLEERKPDIVAFSVISDNYPWALDIAGGIKKRMKAKIVFGGIHPTSVPEYVLKDGTADFIVAGEGEQAFADLLDCLEGGRDTRDIPNIGSYNGGNFYVNPVRKPIPDLDSLPFPDKDLFYDECKMMVTRSYMIMGSRGCNNSCSYCWNSAIDRVYRDKAYFRRRTPGNVIEELKWAKKRYNIKKVTFYDEVFTSDSLWFREFLMLYKEAIKLPFFCCVHPRDIDRETVDLLSKAGCAALNIGIQTVNEETRMKVLNRTGSNRQIIDALKLLKDSSIFVYSNIILGLPDEGEEAALDTLKFCKMYKSDLPSIYWLRYYPGTKIVDLAREKGLLTDYDVEKIKESRNYSPYAISGSTYSKNVSRIGNLILLSGIIPSAVMDFILKRRLYKYMTCRNLLFPAIVFAGWMKRILKGKRHPMHYFNLSDYFGFYLFYMNKKINNLLFQSDDRRK